MLQPVLQIFLLLKFNKEIWVLVNLMHKFSNNPYTVKNSLFQNMLISWQGSNVSICRLHVAEQMVIFTLFSPCDPFILYMF